MLGHADGQSYALWRGNALLAAQQTVTSIAPFALDAIVTNFASLMVHVQAAANNGGALTAQVYHKTGPTQFACPFSSPMLNRALPATIHIPATDLPFPTTPHNPPTPTFPFCL